MTTLSVLRSIENVAQQVANLVTNPGAFNTTTATAIITGVELVIGAVRELPIRVTNKNDIIFRLSQIEAIIASAQAARFITVQQVNSILELLELVTLKVRNLAACFSVC